MLRTLHRWAGLLAGVALLIAAVTGVALVYKKALIRGLITPDAELPTDYGVAEMAAALDRIAALPGFAPDTLIKAPNPDEPYWTLYSAADVPTLLAVDNLAPYTSNRWLLGVIDLMRELHTALLAGVPGEMLLFASAIAGLLLAISGAAIWWRGRRGFHWRWIFPRPVRLPLMLQYHRHSGALAALPLALILLTGTLMLWQKLVGPLLPAAPTTELPRQPTPTEMLTPAAVLTAASRAVPDGWPTYIRLGAADNPQASVRFRLQGEWHPNGRTSVTVDRRSGAMQQSLRADEGSASRRLLNQLYPLHSGYGLHGGYMLLVLLAGLACGWLGITGFVSYFRRRSLRRR